MLSFICWADDQAAWQSADKRMAQTAANKHVQVLPPPQHVEAMFSYGFSSLEGLHQFKCLLFDGQIYSTISHALAPVHEGIGDRQALQELCENFPRCDMLQEYL